MAKKVKDVNWSGLIRTTTFEDNSKIHEKMFDAKLVDGKVINTVENENGTKSYGMYVQLMIGGKPIGNKFSALIYANSKDSEKFDENPFTEGADIKVAMSRAKSIRSGKIKTYARIELPRLVTADDIISDDMLKDLFAMEGTESSEELEPEANSTQE